MLCNVYAASIVLFAKCLTLLSYILAFVMKTTFGTFIKFLAHLTSDNFTLRSSWALSATTTVDTDIRTAPRAGARTIPAP